LLVSTTPWNVLRYRATEQGNTKPIFPQPRLQNPHWNAERQAVEFEYRGVVRVPRRVFQRF